MSSIKPFLTPSGIYINPSASTSTHTNLDTEQSSPALIQRYHESLPAFNETPLHSLPSLAASLGLHSLLVKSESSRLGLPAFKILGASWGVHRALCAELSIDEAVGLEGLRRAVLARKAEGRRFVLYAATDGNHGRAVARMAGILRLGGESVGSEGAVIFVPSGMYETTKRLIRSEGARVVTVEGDYDEAVRSCWEESRRVSVELVVAIMLQDNSFEGYEVVPGWIVEGYATLLSEVDKQAAGLLSEDGGVTGRQITHVVTPIGVGSLGHAVVRWAKSREPPVRVVAVEPETADCLYVSLRAGKSTTIETVDTIMSGMCCGTVSPTSWEALRDGVHASVTVGDWECHETVLVLMDEHGIEAGPCGAGCLAGLRKVLGAEDARRSLDLNENSIVVVLSTEGRREYPVPERPI